MLENKAILSTFLLFYAYFLCGMSALRVLGQTVMTKSGIEIAMPTAEFSASFRELLYRYQLILFIIAFE